MWVVEVPEVPAFTQARHLAEVKEMAVDVAATALGVSVDTVALVHVEFVGVSAEVVDGARQAVRDARGAQERAQQALRTAVQQLRKEGLVQRDVATLLEISHQRVHQIEHMADV